MAQSALSRIRVSAPCFFLGCAADGGCCRFSGVVARRGGVAAAVADALVGRRTRGGGSCALRRFARRSGDGGGWMRDGTAQVALAVCSRWLQVCSGDGIATMRMRCREDDCEWHRWMVRRGCGSAVVERGGRKKTNSRFDGGRRWRNSGGTAAAAWWC